MFKYHSHKIKEAGSLVYEPEFFLYNKIVRYGNNIELTTYKHPPLIYAWVSNVVRTNKTKPMLNGKRRDDSLLRTRMAIYKLMECNMYHWSDSPKFWTFTYAPEHNDIATDIKLSNREFSKFIMRLKHHLGVEELRYLTVIEFQKNDRIHYHTIFFDLPFLTDYGNNLEFYDYRLSFGKRAVYLKNPEHLAMADIWKFGFCFLSFNDNRNASIRSLSSYLAKYLGKENSDSRLYGAKVYFTSRGKSALIKPVVEYNLDNLDEFDNMDSNSVKEFNNKTVVKLLDKKK